MARNNPSNPYTRDPAHTAKDVPLPVQKAKVMAAGDHPEDDAFHTVKIRVYGDQAPYIAPVLTPVFGSVWIPKEGQDVAVIFGDSNKPWVIGAWYPLDRVEDGEVDLPDYEEGDIRLGNESGSGITVHNDGHISIVTDGTERVDVDHQSASVYLGTNYSLPSGGAYNKVPFDTIEDDPEGLFDPSNNSIDTLAGGLYRLSASVELPTPGQNNAYRLAIFVNGTERKRTSRQSAVNEPLGLQAQTQVRLEPDDVIDIRMSNNSGTNRTVLGSAVTTEFNVRRAGI
mgnify:CR=1 FL=1